MRKVSTNVLHLLSFSVFLRLFLFWTRVSWYRQPKGFWDQDVWSFVVSEAAVSYVYHVPLLSMLRMVLEFGKDKLVVLIDGGVWGGADQKRRTDVACLA